MAHHQLDSTTSLLNRLIAFPTISTDSNIDLIQFAADRLDSLGAEVHVSLDGTGNKANLFATLGPKRDGGIVLSGHSDVVPVENQDWTSDPFIMQQRDGRLFGRGTCDMKGFIAASLAMAEDYAALDLARPVHFCFTHDEETGCLGARALMEELKHIGMKPAACIIGEPTLMRIIEGHKGCYEYTTEFSGLAGHGSVPDAGVSAVEYAVRYVSRLMSLRPELVKRCPEGSPFEPPYTTLQIGRINGGIAHNVIADTCVVDWEMRPVQISDATFVKANLRAYVEDELLPAMRAVHPQADIVTHIIGEVVGLEPMPDSEALKLVAELTGANTTDVVCFGTEAGLFQEIGIPTVVCGPGSIEQAHKPDEYVEIDQLDQCLDMLEKLKRKLV
ncbi:MAG: acetylornithine deacetylase [Anderseniella sp.]|jgi:acetylornithine deacetylase|nr:acetylornithine deacetylase [Anderseniella sp.]